MTYQIELRNPTRQDKARARHLLRHCKHEDYLKRHISKNMILKDGDGREVK